MFLIRSALAQNKLVSLTWIKRWIGFMNQRTMFHRAAVTEHEGSVEH